MIGRCPSTHWEDETALGVEALQPPGFDGSAQQEQFRTSGTAVSEREILRDLGHERRQVMGAHGRGVGQVGMDPTQAPAPPKSRTGFVVVGGVLVAASFVGGVLATVVASWVTSVCNNDAATVHAHRQALRLDVLLVWLMITGVPVLFAIAAKRRHRRIWPWAAIAGASMLITLAMTLSIEPSTLCLY